MTKDAIRVTPHTHHSDAMGGSCDTTHSPQ